MQHLWGPDLFRSGQVRSALWSRPLRVDKAAAAGPSHLVIHMVHGCSLNLQRPTNEAMDVRKKDWTA